jgi:hypothetical protein
MEGLQLHKHMFLLLYSQRISTQIGHRQAKREERNYDGIRLKLQCYSKSQTLLTKLIRISLYAMYTLNFKVIINVHILNLKI